MARSSPRSFRPKTPRITPTPPRRGSAAWGVAATSQGFGDLPIVRRQARPRLFELAIRLPELLYEDVAEIPGRLDATGAGITPLKEGCLTPLRLILPDRSIISPDCPAAVIAGDTEVSPTITEALCGALDVIAGSQGKKNTVIGGNETFHNHETIAGGSGAGTGFDGASCVQVHMTNPRATDPEVLETRFPVAVERMAHRAGAGRTGKRRGGEMLTPGGWGTPD